MDNSLCIGIIGDSDPEKPSHIATRDGLNHAAFKLDLALDIQWLPTRQLEEGMVPMTDGLWGAPGSPYESLEGALAGIRFARENDWPFIGT